MWNSLPDPPMGFLGQALNFELTRDEAQVIVDNVQRNQSESLLAALFVRPGIVAEQPFPWGVSQSALPGGVAEVLRHARCFSEVTTGLQFAYNVLVARRAERELGWDTDKVKESQLGRLRGWIELVHRRHSELSRLRVFVGRGEVEVLV